jgi:hypothetical protein
MPEDNLRLIARSLWRAYILVSAFSVLQLEAFWITEPQLNSSLNGSYTLPPLLPNNAEVSLNQISPPPNTNLPLPPEIQNPMDVINNPLSPPALKAVALQNLKEILKTPYKLEAISKNPALSGYYRKAIAEFFSRVAKDSQQPAQLRNLAQVLVKELPADSDQKGPDKGEKADSFSLPPVQGASADKKNDNPFSDGNKDGSESKPLTFSTQATSGTTTESSSNSSPEVFSSVNDDSSEGLEKRVDKLLKSGGSKEGESSSITAKEKGGKTQVFLASSGVSATLSKISLSSSTNNEDKAILADLLDKTVSPKTFIIDYVLTKDRSLENQKLALLLFPEKIEQYLGNDKEVADGLVMLEELLNSEEPALIELAIINMGMIAKKDKGFLPEVISKFKEVADRFALEQSTDTADSDNLIAATLASIILYLMETANQGKVTENEIINLFKNSLEKLPRVGMLLEEEAGERIVKLEELLRHALSRLAEDLPDSVDELIERIIKVYSEHTTGKIVTKNVGS